MKRRMRVCRRYRMLLAAGVLVALSGCLAPEKTGAAGGSVVSLPVEVIAVTTVPADFQIDDVPFGGISGIDRNPETGDWFLISDDRSEYGPARFYLADIPVDDAGIGQIRFRRMVPVQTPSGGLFPPRGTGTESADGESIRYDPRTGELWWSSEGDAAAGAGPSIRRMSQEGVWLGTQALPSMLEVDSRARTGPRPNLSFEGMDWHSDGEDYWLAMEAPLAQDGPLASSRDGALVRISLLSRDGAIRRQRAYLTERVPQHAANRLADNGISEILDLGDGRHLLVLERAGVQREGGGFSFTFRTQLYCTSMDGGEDTSGLATLAGHDVRPAPKRLVLDLAGLAQVPPANFEGMAWGPRLKDGRATLLLVSDNNFDPAEHTTFLLLATPHPADPAWDSHCPGGLPR